MSAELYDAEMAGVLARPAIDVLPTHNSRKGKAEEPVPEPVSAVEAPEAPDAPAEPTVEAPVAELAAPDSFAAPVDAPAAADAAVELAPEALAEAPAPRKVFGMSLTRSRKPKATDAPAEDLSLDVFDPAAPNPSDRVDVPAPELAPAPEVSAETAPADVPAEAAEIVPAAAPATEIVALAPVMTDHTDEVRAMRALLEASEQVRQAAEARTAAAESQLRTVTNTVQEWQIRHREAESTITELAASLAGAEGRMAELHAQLSAAQAERDALISQLDEATSPASS